MVQGKKEVVPPGWTLQPKSCLVSEHVCVCVCRSSLSMCSVAVASKQCVVKVLPLLFTAATPPTHSEGAAQAGTHHTAGTYVCVRMCACACMRVCVCA